MMRALLLVGYCLFAITIPGCLVATDEGLAIDWPRPNVKPVDPVDPKPPNVDPIKKHELRLLIVERWDDRPSLPPSKRAILTGAKLREWVKAHCTKGPDGKTPEFRLWDEGNDETQEPSPWKETLQRKRDTLPYFYVENEKEGTEGPLPEDVDRFIDILTPFTKGE